MDSQMDGIHRVDKLLNISNKQSKTQRYNIHLYILTVTFRQQIYREMFLDPAAPSHIIFVLSIQTIVFLPVQNI